MMMKRRTLLLTGALLWPTSSALAGDAAYELEALADTRGRSTSLRRQARGQRLVVVTIKGTWCKVCIEQLTRLQKIRHALAERGARVVALSSERPKQHASAAKRYDLRMPLLSDPKRRVLRKLGLWLERPAHPMPAMVVFDRCGRERGRQLGRRPGARREKQLLAFLDELVKAPANCHEPSA